MDDNSARIIARAILFTLQDTRVMVCEHTFRAEQPPTQLRLHATNLPVALSTENARLLAEEIKRKGWKRFRTINRLGRFKVSVVIQVGKHYFKTPRVRLRSLLSNHQDGLERIHEAYLRCQELQAS